MTAVLGRSQAQVVLSVFFSEHNMDSGLFKCVHPFLIVTEVHWGLLPSV